MKITVRETTIEADAKELRESRTLADSFSMMLFRCFQPADLDEEEEPDE